MSSRVLITVCTFTTFFSKLYSIIRYKCGKDVCFTAMPTGIALENKRDTTVVVFLAREQCRRKTVNLPIRFFILIIRLFLL